MTPPARATGEGNATSRRSRPTSAGGSSVADWEAAYGVTDAATATSPWTVGTPSGDLPGHLPVVMANRYAVSVASDGVTIVDLARTRRAAILEQLKATSGEDDGVSRPLLLPLSAGVEPAVADRLESKLDALAEMGFDLRRNAPASITLRAAPACLAHVPAASLLDTIVRWTEGKAEPEFESLLNALARIGGEQLEDLVNDPQAVLALLRFLDARSGKDDSRLKVRLDAAAIGDLIRR